MNVNLYWDTNVECEFCEATFDSQDSLMQHLMLHSRRKPYKCGECGTRFSYNSTLEWHKKSHAGEMPFKCDECNAQFTQNSMLVWHKRKHRMVSETSQNPPIVVSMTNIYHQQGLQNFQNMFSVSGVVTASPATVANTVAVPVCTNEPVSDVVQNEIQVNSSCVPAQPIVATTSSPSGLLVNILGKRKLGKVEGTVRCDICTSFVYSADLKGHMETKHNMGEKNPFHILAKQQQANGHYNLSKRKVILEKPFKCDLCYAGFNTEGHLKSHRQKHVVERPYKCVKCRLTFSDKSIMESHERRHQAERPFKCDRCGATFFRESHLQKHIKRHTGEMV